MTKNKNTKNKNKKNKMNKTTKHTSKPKVTTIKHSVAVKPSIIEVLPSEPLAVKRAKMDFDNVYMVFDSLYVAFHADRDMSVNGEVDEQFIAFWTLFLMAAGYTEKEFWDLMDQEHGHDHECEKCVAERSNKDEEEIELTLLEPKPIPDKQSN